MTSLLIIAHEAHDTLSLHLPALLQQQGTDYEVVVVDMNSEDNTIELLNSLEELYPLLKHLSLPLTARDISRERLALHLGMRASNYNRVIVIKAGSILPSPDWLSAIESRWRADCEIMLIPIKRVRARRLGDYFTAGHEAWRNRLYHKQALNHRLFRSGSAIVGVDKTVFLTDNPPARHLALSYGTMDIFVAHSSNRYNTIVLDEPSLIPTEDAISSPIFWQQSRLFDVETRQHLPKRFMRHITYLFHCLCTIHKGSIPYCLMDIKDHLRWRFTSKKTFMKRHY